MYYGQEQGFHGNSDPYNREPLWPSGYANTTAYQLATKLNQVCIHPDGAYVLADQALVPLVPQLPRQRHKQLGLDADGGAHAERIRHRLPQGRRRYDPYEHRLSRE